ncbi:MAG: hypothetical protein NC180_07245 [Muribaculaceae bacterium]|nr:hypothetical protein [Roseburia sp.]MCM1429974.1 hypothetical protein [Muribaculaceae bacterium]MCM1492999.1 hypothetical protein [Muribaculaceae bacterium]
MRTVRKYGANGKKQLIFICMGLLMAAALCGCGEEETKHDYISAKTLSYDSLEQMEEDSDLIVRGIRLDKEENEIQRENGLVISAYCFSDFWVTDIYKKKEDEDIQEGAAITILENEAYDEEADVVYHVSGYNKMIAGDEYLLFLHEAEYEETKYYVAAGVNYGTVSLQADKRTESYTSETGELVNFSIYEEIWQAAKEKYAENSIERYLSVELPRSLEIGEHSPYMFGPGDGYLFTGDYEEPPHGKDVPAYRLSPGGIYWGAGEDRKTILSDGVIVEADYAHDNHAAPVSGLEPIDGCECIAAIQKWSIDRFTAVELEELNVAKDIAGGYYWFIYMAKEDSAQEYIFFLDAGLFSREEAVRMAQSVHFTEEAF